MAILVRCECGSKISAPQKYLGKTVACPSCGDKLKITDQESKSKSSELISFDCECGKTLRARPTAVGKKTNCPQCANPITIPAATAPKQPQPAAVEDPSSSSIFDGGDDTSGGGTDISGLLDEIGAHECKTNRRCPNCKSDMQREDVLCIECGYNTKTKKVMGEEKTSRGSAILSSVRGLFSEP